MLAGSAVQPWQRLELAPLGLDATQCARELQWVDVSTGERASGHRAVAMALRGCRRPWPLLGRLVDLPVVSLIARVVYRLVAVNRHRLPGGTPACRLSDAPADRGPASR